MDTLAAVKMAIETASVENLSGAAVTVALIPLAMWLWWRAMRGR